MFLCTDTFLICFWDVLSHQLLTKCDYTENADLSFRKLVLCQFFSYRIKHKFGFFFVDNPRSMEKISLFSSFKKGQLHKEKQNWVQCKLLRCYFLFLRIISIQSRWLLRTQTATQFPSSFSGL